MPSAIAPPTSGPMRDRDPGDRAEQADRRSPALGRERGAQQRQTQRQHERRAGALDCPGHDQPADAGRQRARRRRRGEQAQPDGVEGAAPVPVAERSSGDQQHREAQVVGVDRPLELLDRGAQIEPDRAQSGRDHERVQGGHQRADGGQGDHPCGRRPLTCLCGSRAHLTPRLLVVRRRNCRSGVGIRPGPEIHRSARRFPDPHALGGTPRPEGVPPRGLGRRVRTASRGSL